VQRTINGSVVRHIEYFTPREWTLLRDYHGVDAGVVWDGGAEVAVTSITASDFIDRGDCESATPPMVRGETVPVLVNATFTADATQFYAGTQSYRFTKTVAAGTDSFVYLVDAYSTTDMHGFLPGQTVTKRYRLRIPSGAMLGSECQIQMLDYGGGAWDFNTETAQNIYDAWQEVTITRTLRAGCTGMLIRLIGISTAELNEYFNVDEIQIPFTEVIAIAHPFVDDDLVRFRGISGMPELNGEVFTVKNKTTNAFDLFTQDGSTGFDSSGLGPGTGGIAEKVSNAVTGLSHLNGETVTTLGDRTSVV
jgi:hypothetical protein